MKCKRGDYKSKTTLLLSTSLMLLLHCGVIIYCSYMLSYFLKLQTPMEYIDSNIEAFVSLLLSRILGTLRNPTK